MGGSIITHYLDIFGAIFSFISTLLYVFASVWAWPVGIAATIINGTLYGVTGIYGDMSLEVVYFISMFYGWYRWTSGGRSQLLAVRSIQWRVAGWLFSLGVLFVFVVYSVLARFTNSHVPVMDATSTVFSLIAQWMTCNKLLECWIVWFCVDALYVGLYIYKGIPFHSLLLFVYLGMAVFGYIRWYRLKGGAVNG